MNNTSFISALNLNEYFDINKTEVNPLDNLNKLITFDEINILKAKILLGLDGDEMTFSYIE